MRDERQPPPTPSPPPDHDLLTSTTYHHQRRSIAELRSTGASFLDRVRRRGAEAQQPALYDRLARLWGGDRPWGVYEPGAALPPLDTLRRHMEDPEELSTICNKASC